MAERCVCGHDFWDHDNYDLPEDDPHRYDCMCSGDLGDCTCEEFTYLGEEDEDNG